MNELTTTYEASQALASPKGKNYKVTAFGAETILKRDVDFGVIPGTKQPSLFKSGAEKIAMTYGLLQQYSIESKIEQLDPPFFYYAVKCELVKIVDGTPYVFTTGYGSANTNEKRNGRNSAFDSANSTLKMAQKRALVSASISISGLSDLFTQDMENETFMDNANEVIKSADPKSIISKQQQRALYALGAYRGMNAKELKAWLKEHGINSTGEITQEKYETIWQTLNDYEVTENEV